MNCGASCESASGCADERERDEHKRCNIPLVLVRRLEILRSHTQPVRKNCSIPAQSSGWVKAARVESVQITGIIGERAEYVLGIRRESERAISL